ncbi:hypothetical protein R2R70_16555 [Cobetia sp. SIMBA_158]|uniref:hypothetical protein n=1 Tax=Cobetia sp. SIMBA_158 TaxID=3081617 RepID=UPI00397F71EC
MNISSTTEAHGEDSTRLNANGAEASSDPADQLFYLTGTNTILMVPREAMLDFNTEMSTLEALVEAQQSATAELKQWQDRYIAYVQSNYFKPNERSNIEDAGGVGNKEAVGMQVLQAKVKLNQANRRLNEVIDSLSSLDSKTNNIVELIALQRRGAKSSSAGFRMGYVRSEKISSEWNRYSLSPSGHEDIVDSAGQVDWITLRDQIQSLSNKLDGKEPWIDGWLALEDQEKELYQWSQATNVNLQVGSENGTNGEHDPGSIKVELTNEAQLMRWAHGAGGISVTSAPYEQSGTIKSTGHAELMLAQAKSELHCYEPPGGYMMAFQLPMRESASTDGDTSDKRNASKSTQLIDLGMIRSHLIVIAEGGVGASIAAELNIEADLSQANGRTVGTRGTLDTQALPGMQRLDMSTSEEEDDAGNQVRAFVGAEMSCTVTGQVEWKNPEVNEFRPFAKLAPALTAQVGGGFEGGLYITYGQSKFKFMAKAGFCWGVGAKGKVSGEIDKGLLLEFIKWVAYQLRHVNYQRLEFIGTDSFQAISEIVYGVILTGEKIEDFLADSVVEISKLIDYKYKDFMASIREGRERGALTDRINGDPSLLKYATPEAKGAILYLLTETSVIDGLDPRNAVSPIDKDAWRAGALPNRKRAIIRVFEWVQSKAEFDCVMQRVQAVIDTRKITYAQKAKLKVEGEARVYSFLNLGEFSRESWYGNSLNTSDYDSDLRRIYQNLPDKAPKGAPLVKNNVQEYFSQVKYGIDPNFYIPCGNKTSSICSPKNFMVV